MEPQNLAVQVGHLAGRFDALEEKVGSMHDDIRTLLASEARREGAKSATEESADKRLKRFALYAGGGGGILTLLVHQIGRKLGFLS